MKLLVLKCTVLVFKWFAHSIICLISRVLRCCSLDIMDLISVMFIGESQAYMVASGSYCIVGVWCISTGRFTFFIFVVLSEANLWGISAVQEQLEYHVLVGKQVKTSGVKWPSPNPTYGSNPQSCNLFVKIWMSYNK